MGVRFTIPGLPLDDDRWAELEHAYGGAEDIPALLLALAAANDDDADRLWEDAMSALMHQGDLFDATFAALPYVVALAADGQPTMRLFYLDYAREAVAQLADRVLADDLRAWAEGAVPAARAAAIRGLVHLTGTDFVYAMSAVATFDGATAIGRGLAESIDGGDLGASCPTCEAPVELELAGVTPADRAAAEHLATAAGDHASTEGLADLARLVAAAWTLGRHDEAAMIARLARGHACPSCGAETTLVDALAGATQDDGD